MSISEDLEALGLSNYEAKAYAALQELGEAKAGLLSEKSEVPTSHLYRVMDLLIKKGLATQKTANKTKIFIATPPEALTEYLSTKAKEIKLKEATIIKQLELFKKIPKKHETTSNYQYFEGITGIKSLFLAINEQMKPNSQAEVFSANTKTWEKLDAFILEHHQIRVKKNVHERMILPKAGKGMAPARKKIGKIDIRYLEHENEAEYGVFGDLVAILYYGSKTPRGFLIKDSMFAQMFKNIFDFLWQHAIPDLP